MKQCRRIQGHGRVGTVGLLMLALLLPGCSKKPETGTEIGQGGSAGPAGAQGAGRRARAAAL